VIEGNPFPIVIAGLDPAILTIKGFTFFAMDARVIRTFTPVFDGPCPRMTFRKQVALVLDCDAALLIDEGPAHD
jgi:hypothetical protein